MDNSIIDELIDEPKVRKQFDDLDKRIQDSIEKLKGLVDVGKNLEFEVKANGMKSMQDMIAYFNRAVEIEKAYRVEAEKNNELLAKRADLMQRAIDGYLKNSDAVKKLSDVQSQLAAAEQKIIELQNKYASTTNNTVSAIDNQTQATAGARKTLSEMYGQYNTTIIKLRDYGAELERLKGQYSKLGDASKEGEKGKDIQQRMRDLREEMQILNKQRNEQFKAIEKEEQYNNLASGSIAKLREDLKRLTVEYDHMGSAMQQSSAGQALKQQIVEISGELNRLEGETNRYGRTVGNYENSIISALSANESWAGSIMKMFVNQEKMNAIQTETQSAMAGATSGFQRAGIAAKGFGKQLLALLANPVVLIIAAIAVAIKLVVDAVKSNEEASRSLQRTLAPLKGLLNFIKNAFQALVEVILKVVEAYMNFLRGISKLAERLPIIGKLFKTINDRMEESIELEKRSQKLEDDRRKALVENAKTEYEVSELRNKIAQKDEYTAEQRLEFIQDAIELEKQMAEEKFRLAKEEYEINKALSEQDKGSAEENQKLKELEAKMYEALTERAGTMRKLDQQAASERANIRKEQLEAEKLQIDLINLRLQTESDALKKITSDENKSIKERLEAYRDFQKKQAQILRANANIAIKEAEGNQDKINLINAQLQNDLNKLAMEGEDFRSKLAIKMQERIAAARLQIVDLEINAELDKLKKIADGDNANMTTRIEANKKYYETRQKQIEDQYERELLKEGLLTEEIVAIEAQKQDELRKLREEAEQNSQKILIDSVTKQINYRKDRLKTMEEAEIAGLNRANMTREEYEAAKLEIVEKYAKETFDVERQTLLDSIKLIEEQIEEIGDTPELLGKLDELYKQLNQSIIKNNDEMMGKVGDSHKSIWDKWMSDVAKALGLTDEQMQQFVAAMASTINSVGELFKAASDGRIQAIEAEMEVMNERHELEKEQLAESIMGDEERAIAEKTLAQQQKVERQQLEQQKKEEQKKQAQFEKKWALGQVIIDTAVGILKTIGTVGLPGAIPLIAAVAAAGIAQGAVIAAQPIPSYEKGTEDHKGGLAKVGEKRHEAVLLPSGRIIKTPARPTLMDLPKHSIVKPDWTKFVASQARDLESQTRDIIQMRDISEFKSISNYKELLEINKKQADALCQLVRQKPHSVSVQMDPHSIFQTLENENKKQTYINQQLHRKF